MGGRKGKRKRNKGKKKKDTVFIYSRALSIQIGFEA